MKILVVAPGPKFSTFDTFNYYTEAFAALGHEVNTFKYHDYYAYHAGAHAFFHDVEELDEPMQMEVIRISSEYLISRIARTTPDLIFVISGLALPHGTWQWLDEFRNNLKKKFATMVLFTESPYVDESQFPILEMTDLAATTDKASLGKFLEINPRSMYVRHAYNPMVHRMMPYSKAHSADVFMVGTGFPERIELLAGVDWTGIDLRVFGGSWDEYKDADVLKEYVTLGNIDNRTTVPSYYTNSKINVNIFRTAKWPGDNVIHIDPGSAYSVSPRCYEIMGCGGFLLTDKRPELLELFKDGRDFVSFDSPESFEDKVRYYLTHEREREKIAINGLRAVAGHTYIDRAADVVEFVENNWRN